MQHLFAVVTPDCVVTLPRIAELSRCKHSRKGATTMIRFLIGAGTALALATAVSAQDTNTQPADGTTPPPPANEGALLGGGLTPELGALAAATGIALIVLGSDGSDGTTTTTTTSP